MICIGIISALLITSGTAEIPQLAEVASAIANRDWNTNYAALWTNLQGDEMVESAVDSRDPDQIKTAMVLAGKVMAHGEPIAVKTNGLSTLCEVIASPSMKGSFFSEDAFQEKKHEYIENRQSFLDNTRLKEQRECELFPLQNLLYVCTNGVPISVKAAILKINTLFKTVSKMNKVALHDTLIPSNNHPPSLDLSFEQLLQATSNDKSQLMSAVEFELYSSQDLVSNWLAGIIKTMITASEFFVTNKKGAYELVLKKDKPLAYLIIGRLLGLAIIYKIPISQALDPRLLRSITMHPENKRVNWLPAQVQTVRTGFYDVIPAEAISGNSAKRASLIKPRELGNIFKGKY